MNVSLVFLLLCQLGALTVQTFADEISNGNKRASARVGRCCESSSAENLLACLGQTAYRYDQCTETAEESSSASFLVHQYMTPNIYHYGAYGYACTAAYCAKHGYSLSLITDNDLRDMHKHGHAQSLPYTDIHKTNRDQRWNKVWILHQSVTRLLDSPTCQDNDGDGDREGEREVGGCYVAWMDSDLVVVNMNLKLEHFTASFPYAHLLISKDFKKEHGMVNSGMIIFRVSDWSKRFLERWWTPSEGQRGMFSDQHVFSQVFQQQASDLDTGIGVDLDEYVVFLEPEALNSKFPTWYEFQPHHNVLHLAGVHSILRVNIFKHAFHSVCSSLSLVNDTGGSNGDIFAPQLNLSSESQLEILRSTRSQEIGAAFEVKEKASKNSKIPVDDADIELLQEHVQTALQMGYAARDVQHSGGKMCTSVHGRFDVVRSEIAQITVLLAWTAQVYQQRVQDATTGATGKLNLIQSAVDSTFQLLEHLKEVPPFVRASHSLSDTVTTTDTDDTKTRSSDTATDIQISPQESIYWKAIDDVTVMIEALENEIIKTSPSRGSSRSHSNSNRALRSLYYYNMKRHDFVACGKEQEGDSSGRIASLRLARNELVALSESYGGDASLQALPEHLKEEGAVINITLAQQLCTSMHIANHNLEGIALAKSALRLIRQLWLGRVKPLEAEQQERYAEYVYRMCSKQ